jgi:DNA-binding transcriptional ArsR family regulator
MMASRKQDSHSGQAYRVTDLEQVRAMADPLRLKILGAFGQEMRTTKQVATILGEKPSKLYHHVEALERARLIELKETRPNRGTTEKYYRAVATQFEVASSLLSTAEPPDARPTPALTMLDSILQTTRSELLTSLPAVEKTGESDPRRAVIGRMIVHASEQRITSMREQLLGLMKQWETECGKDSRKQDVSSERQELTYGLTIAFYPIHAPKPSAKPSKRLPGAKNSGTKPRSG